MGASNQIKKNKFLKFIKYLVLSLYAVTTLVPFLWILANSFKENSEIFAKPFSLPSVYMFSNYVEAWKNAKLGTYFFNSAFVSFSAIAIILIFGAMAAYIISRIKPSLLLYTFFTLGIMIPIHTVLIPTFVLMKTFHLYNSRIGLVIIYAVSNLSLGIFILCGFMKTFPKAIEESAFMDGASMTRTFFTIVLPLTRPGLATVGTVAFLNCWNEYLFAYILISKDTMKTMTQGIFSLIGSYNTNYGPLCAGLVVAIVPVVIMYIIFQEQVIEGMTAGAVKG